MTEKTAKAKRDEFFKRLADLMEEFDVQIDVEDVGTYGGVPEIVIGSWQWSSKDQVTFTGHYSWNAKDIRRQSEI